MAANACAQGNWPWVNGCLRSALANALLDRVGQRVVQVQGARHAQTVAAGVDGGLVKDLLVVQRVLDDGAHGGSRDGGDRGAGGS